ncbi:MAG TPA: helix-turn-helix domain-containing protein [Acidimicrobiia bacterium]|jgi:predicted ArsR family transcriptional regulator|nr:helix-turn-helix domain-containing protein [Acidimicrobiia bacterium]
MDPLPVFKALGDDTRFAIYKELGRSPAPCSAAELAERLTLHPNTVRPHLDRMREAGLVEVEPIHRGTVGRPQLRYSLAPGAPGLGLDPPAHTLLAGLLAALAEQLGGDGLDAANLGRRWGNDANGRRPSGRGCLTALVAELDRLGFDPVESELGGGGTESRRVRVDFLHCPFRELAEAYPELVCNLHRGIVEGVVVNSGRSGQPAGMVEDFRMLSDRDPCNVTVSVGYAESSS